MRHPEQASSQTTPIGRITEDYTSYLRQRNLSDATVVGYLPFIRRFLMDRFGPGPIDFSALCAADVIGFISRQAARLIAKRAKTSEDRDVRATLVLGLLTLSG